MDKNKIDFELNDNLTYCDRTKHVGTIVGLSYPFFFLILVQLFVLAIPFGIGTFIGAVAIESLILFKLKRRNIPVRLLFFYLQERRTTVRRAIPKRRLEQIKATERLINKNRH